jgi:flavorubredoxin
MAIEIRPDIYWIGTNDRSTDLFEGLWPIEKEGISYNSYLVVDDRTAVIDLATADTADAYLDRLAQAVDLARLNYVVINHMEPDHTGALQALRVAAPNLTILCSKKASAMLEAFYGIHDGIQIVEDGEEIPLGHRNLRFLSTPSLHWPETIMTYEDREQILFSGDAFGSYGALLGAIFDDECPDLEFYEHEALRYYATILPIYSTPVLKALKKLANLPVSVVAPAHGLVWRSQPQTIVDLYRRWAGYGATPPETGVTLLYGSMYGNTAQMMESVAQGIRSQGMPLTTFDVARTHPAYILPVLWSQRGVMVGAPTYDGSLFPSMTHVLDVADHKRVRGRPTAYFGSYGWNGGGLRCFKRMIEPLKWDLMDTLEFAGRPTLDDLAAGEELGARFARFVAGK